MGKLTDGGPAFPCSNEQFTYGNPVAGDAWAGLSLRDWFAGQALAMSAPVYVNLPDSADILAKRCYAVADAMLRTRAPQQAEGGAQ